MPDKGEQRDRRERRRTDGKNDVEERLKMAGAVDIRGLFQLFRQAAHVVHDDEHVEHLHGARQDQRPDRIHKPGVLDHHIRRNQATGKQDCNDKVPGKHVAQAEILLALRERVRRKNNQCDIDQHTENSPLHGDPERAQELVVAENEIIRRRIEADRPEGNGVCRDRSLIRKGNCKQIDKRQNAGQRNNRQYNIIDYKKDLS